MKRLLRNICIVFCVGLILIPLYLNSRTPDTNRLSDDESGTLTVTVADLGKADAILLQSGEHAMLIDAGYTPVVAPITADAEGEGLLNTNADTVAQTVAVGMSAVYETELVYCFEKRGVLLDVNDDDSVIAEITPDRFAELRTRGIVADGMLPKLENAFRAIDSGVRSVAICSADRIASPGYGGTTLRK